MIALMNHSDSLEILPEEAIQLVGNKTFFIDLREEFEFQDKQMDVKNVFNFPFSSFEKNLSKIPKDTMIVLICATGVQSKRASEILRKYRYKTFSVLTGGIIHWAMEGYPMKSNPDKLPEDIFNPHPCKNSKEGLSDIID